MHRLTGVIREYDWGDEAAIAGILGHEPPGHPEAEYWLGAHPAAPSLVEGRDLSLDAMIAARTNEAVGDAVWERFSGIPFLLKILAASQPLSIQAHPNLDQARAGFAAEDAAGIDRAAPNRNYRDKNHKPELICAITPFETKCGFRPVAETRDLVSVFSGELPERLLTALREPGDDESAEEDLVAGAVRWLLDLPNDVAGSFADLIVEQAEQLLNDGLTPERFRTEIEWSVKIGAVFPGDIGVVVALLLNHVSLAPGQAIFLQAGNLHSHLQGVGVEVMANSDNVLRGGFTAKHVDVDELLRVVDYRPSAAPVQIPQGSVHRFESPVPEFSLTRLSSADGAGDVAFGPVDFKVAGPEILLVTGGEVNVVSDAGTLVLAQGDAALVTPGDGSYRITDQTPGDTVAWRAAANLSEAD